ncbi:MAG: acyl-CoA dehydrogenase protein [Actinomycetia bacterium]|nr:acyl-CoA dehydrogenase protein [Actinomycetes bacterium]
MPKDEATSTEDEELLRSAVRAALEQLSTSEDVRRAMATAQGYEDKTWQRLSRELGLPGLTIAEEYGGAGLTEAVLGIAIGEAGASLLCAPLFATAGLALPLLKALGDERAIARYAPRIAAADLTATVALAEDSGRWLPAVVAATARRAGDGDGWLLNGVKNYVVDGGTAGLILVVARAFGEALPAAGELGVFAVDKGAAGLETEQLVTLDQTRKQARLTLGNVGASLVGVTGATAVAAVDKATAVSRALLAAEQAGGAQHCLDMTVEYARARIQFGRAIGSFQAIKQRLAEMLILTESAKSAAYAALAAAGDASEDKDAADLEHVAAAAALTAGEAYAYVSAQTVQLHGGIGFTWEHDAHLYFKRARASALLLGTASELTDLIGCQLAAII